MHRTTPLLCLVAIVGAGVIIAQPSLSPPAGPVTETGRFGTLIELSQETAPGDAGSVFRITQPGSYVLTGDIEVPVGANGILLASDDITLDLNGYAIRGVEASGNAGISVRNPSAGNTLIESVVIRNGLLSDLDHAVRLFEQIGSIPFTTSAASGVSIEGLTIRDCTLGIRADRAAIRECNISVAEQGIHNPVGSVHDCAVTITDPVLNGSGISVADGVVGRSSVEVISFSGVSNNAFIVNGSTVSSCTALLRGDSITGFFYANFAANVRGCVVRRSGGNNLVGFNGVGLTADCVAQELAVGFVSNNGVVNGCSATFCATSSNFAAGVVSVNNNF